MQKQQEHKRRQYHQANSKNHDNMIPDAIALLGQLTINIYILVAY